jgi:hypothetical protein
MRINISRLVTTAVLAVGLMVSGFSASAALIYMSPSSQLVANNASFSVDILAEGLPEGTSGGALDLSWSAAAMTLDSVFLATTDPADNGGGLFPGPWDPESSFFSGPGTIGIGSLTSLFVGSFTGVAGDQPIARLNFTLGAGVTNATINVAAAAIGGTWSAWDGINDPYDFTNDYEGAVVNPVSAIPVPAAIWLFGSGVVGLVGVARRRS